MYSDQGLALFRQKQILSSTSHTNLQKQDNEDFLFNYTMLVSI